MVGVKELMGASLSSNDKISRHRTAAAARDLIIRLYVII